MDTPIRRCPPGDATIDFDNRPRSGHRKRRRRRRSTAAKKLGTEEVRLRLAIRPVPFLDDPALR